MSTEVKVPTLGESVTEATIGQWFKKAGDTVAQDETIAELETDKVTVEVPAPAAGVLSEILVKEGETVEVGALIAVIGEAGSAGASRRSPRRPRPAPKAPEPAATQGYGNAPPRRPRPPAAARRATRSPAPSAAKLMAEKNLSASDVEGSGKRGQVLKGDVLDAIAKGPPPRRRRPRRRPHRVRPPRPTTRRARSACG